MIIKKFQGKTEAEAVSLAKKEMGENVVVMSSRDVKKKGLFSIFRRKVVEITVGMEEESERQISEAFSQIAKVAAAADMTADRPYVPKKEEPVSTINAALSKSSQPAAVYTPSSSAIAHTSSPASSSHVIEKRLDSLQTLLEQQLTKETKEEDFSKDADDSTVSFLKLIYSTLIDNEVDEKYVNEIMAEIGKLSNQNASIDLLLANIYQKMILKFGQPVTIPLGLDKQRVIFFIGPTGVGKTTTIAKLASKLCVNHKKKVVLLTTDTYRIAAAEQLRTYASILEAPFRVIYTEDEMTTALSDFKDYDYILVDTAGHSHHNAEQKDSMAHFLNSVDDSVDKDIYLVVSATTKYRDLLSIADAYSEFTDYKLIFTKLDETTTFGNLFNLCMHTGASMSYVTCGQNVPDDIEVFSPQSTVKQLLGGK